jgi:uncharacterized membrane protein
MVGGCSNCPVLCTIKCGSYEIKEKGQSMKKASNEMQLLRSALIPTGITGVVSIVASFTLAGLPGLYGAFLAQFIVVIFFAVTLWVSKLSKNLDPLSTMGLALFSYTTKLLLIGVFLWVLTTYTDREAINRTSFGVAAILLSLSWLGGEIASYMKLRIHLPLPEKAPTPPEEI